MPYSDKNADECWTTEKEKKFIDGLGSWVNKKGDKCHELTRRELLEKYTQGLSERSVWDQLDRTELIKYAMQQLHIEINRFDKLSA